MREFSHKCMMIHREVLGLSWLLPTGYQAPSMLTKMAADETSKVVLRFSFEERFSRFERLYNSGAVLMLNQGTKC